MKQQLAILDEFYTKVCHISPPPSASILLEITEEVIINVSLAVLADLALSSTTYRCA
jgi:hypothetical protein